MVRLLLFLWLSGAPAAVWGDDGFRIVWPTSNPAYASGASPENYVQPTVSGLVESGFFGCVRNSGTRFHEGLDLSPIARDGKGEAIDPVFAVMDGVVLHASRVAGYSSYGRYIVLEHRHVVPAVTTLYAHLARIDDAIQPGAEVKIGQTIGIMGRSAAGYVIPKERAHLHFEIGFWISENFQSWYDWKRFGSKNRHGLLNGMNMIGIDPTDFFDRYRDGTVGDFQSYLAQLPVAYTVRVRAAQVPDFVRRHPSLAEGSIPVDGPGGWEIDFTSYGLPTRFRALAPDDPSLRSGPRAAVISYDPEIAGLHACRKALRISRGEATIGSLTEKMLQLMFDFR